MFDGLFIVSLVGSCIGAIKEAFEPTIPAENWANKKLYHQDMANGVPIEQCMKNAQNGKYKLTETYPEPHKDAEGKIIIENNLLYKKDLENYGAYKTMQWAKQGKYNLSSEELRKEHERLNKKYEYLYNL